MTVKQPDTQVWTLSATPGAPTTGTHVAGELVLDSLGQMWVCLVGGVGTAALWGNVAGPNLGAITPLGGAFVGTMPAPQLAPSSIFDTQVAPTAAIREDKLALMSDAADGIPSRRSLGFQAGQAPRRLALPQAPI